MFILWFNFLSAYIFFPFNVYLLSYGIVQVLVFNQETNNIPVGLEMYSSYKHLLLLFIRVQEKPLPLAFQLSLTSCIKELSKKLIERMKTKKRLTF